MSPKRVIHGEGIWNSDKLASVDPIWVRAEYANLVPLALANGVFEFNVKRIWATVYAYNRPDITVEKVKEIFDSLVRAGLLFVWSDSATGKQWGFWVGIDKTGRLPSKSRLQKGHDATGPNPPHDDLKEYISQPSANHWQTIGQVGSGVGSGSGKNISSEVRTSDEQIPKATPSNEPSSVAIELAELLRDRIVANNENARVTSDQVKKWAIEADRMISRDRRSSAEIGEVIEFSQADTFWRSNILSMGKLREKFDQLWLKRTSAVKPLPISIQPKRRSALSDAGRHLYAKSGISL